MKRLIVGTYCFLTKIHLIDLKGKLEMKYSYVRNHFDHIIIDYNKNTKIKIAQDGLVYLDTTDFTKTPLEWYNILREGVLKKVVMEDDELSFRQMILKKEPVIIVITDSFDKKIFESTGRKYDYTMKASYGTKHYGQGLVVFEKMKLTKLKTEELIETQLFFADYQEFARRLLEYNQAIWDEVSNVRMREQLRFKDIPNMINDLVEYKRVIGTAISHIQLIDHFLERRKTYCNIRKELDELKLYDYDELKVLNKYVKSQFYSTKEHIMSTVRLTEDLYKENEQKEFNILQVIFAVGTIAAIVSLGAMPGARLYMEITGNTVAGEMISFNTPDLIFWTIISISIGIFLFVLLNYFFLSAKKLRIVSLFKKE
ncbi:MAG: hypothetical protein ACMXYL_05355 [Candidatus Woesearchaeota archaeon]